MENRKLSIKVSIDGKQLSLTVADTEEEKLYRDAASMCQSKIQKFRAIYPSVPSDAYYYLMAMLNTAVEAAHISNRHDTEPFLETMEDLEKEIDQLVKK